MQEQVRLGIIGSGHMGNLHVRNYLLMPEVKIVAVCDVVPEAAKKLAAFCKADMYTDVSKLLERDDINAVAICVPTLMHRDIAVEAAGHHKHIALEKPIARTLEDADDIINAARKAGVKFMVCHQMRITHQRVKRIIERGAIGRITVIKATIPGWTPVASWFYEDEVGGGVTIDTCVHCADALRWLVGSEVSRVYAEGDALVLERSKEKKTPDNVEILMKFQNGVIGEIYGTWSAKAGSLRLDIYGSEGSIFVDSMSNPIKVFSKEGFIDLEPENSVSKGWNFLSTRIAREEGWFPSDRHFIDCIIKDEKPLISGEDARAALEIVLAAHESAKIGKPVKLPLG